MSDKPETRVIKKYPNRRLYDSGQSRYITLDELKDMVIAGESFSVRDAKSGEDLTRQVLIQALLSEESFGQPVMSEEALRNLVAFFHGPFRGPMAAYFEQCMPFFLESQRRLQGGHAGSLSPDELEKIAAAQGAMMRRVMEQYVFGNMENFINTQAQMQENMQKMMSGEMNPMFNMPDFFKPPDKKK